MAAVGVGRTGWVQGGFWTCQWIEHGGLKKDKHLQPLGGLAGTLRAVTETTKLRKARCTAVAEDTAVLCLKLVCCGCPATRAMGGAPRGAARGLSVEGALWLSSEALARAGPS